jgi:hypothetical protein
METEPSNPTYHNLEASSEFQTSWIDLQQKDPHPWWWTQGIDRFKAAELSTLQSTYKQKESEADRSRWCPAGRQWRCLHVNWYAQFGFRHVVSLLKKKTTRSLISTLEIEMTRATKHVTLRWHCRRKCRCQLTFVFVFENVTWHFGFGGERQMKFVKHTHWFEGRLSPSTAQPRTYLKPMLFQSTYMYKVPIREFGCTTIFVHN